MTIIAGAQLAVIVALVLLLVRQHRDERRAILDVVAAAEAERADLLNAARNPAHFAGQHNRPARVAAAPTEEQLRRARALSTVGTVDMGDDDA